MKIEEKMLDFVFEIVNVQFNQLGQYRLELTVENPLLAGSSAGVQLRVKNGEVLQTSSISTDTVEQASLDEICAFSSNVFVFTLPKGFCKNDKNHDVRLKVEAVRVADPEVKAGEGFFAIYPRTNTPRINLYADPDEELYQYNGIMALLRVKNDYLAMHCGRLLYSVALHESRPGVVLNELSSSLPVVKKDKLLDGKTASCSLCGVGSVQEQVSLSGQLEKRITLRPQSAAPIQNPKPHPDAEIDISSEVFQSSPSSETPTEQLGDDTEPDSNSLALFSHNDTPSQSPKPFPYTHVLESPLRRAGASLSFSPTHAHVSHPGDEIISVTVHGATSLPPLRDGGTPLPFAILCSGVDGRRRSQAVTHCPLQPTHNPCWEETLSMELLDIEVYREAFTADQVRRQLRRLHPRKAAGPDKVVPATWKTTCLIPVPKKAHPKELNDYRPVALTSHVMKTMERLLLNHLRPQVHHAEDPLQFAYREKVGVEDAILYLLHRTHSHLDKGGGAVRVMFFDFSSAFNTIQPLLLRDKLMKMEVDMHLVTWITDYLTGRPQHVRIRDCSSDTVISSTGAPQGTVLSPVLFTLYTSDFKYNSELCHMQKFSDDTAIVGCVRNGQEREYRSLVEDFVEWCTTNHLKLNITKTKEMCIDFRRSRPSQQPISIKGVDVEVVRSYRYLGVHLDERLDWICQKLLLMFYQSVVASVLFYAVVCWGGSISKRDAGRLDRLKKPQPRAVQSESLAECRTPEEAEDVVIDVAHGPSQELLAHYRLPSASLEPFHHYHLELVQPHRAVPSGVRLYVTMVRKLSLLPRLPCFSFAGFEVLLQCMDHPLKDPVGPLLAVARVVAEYDSYRDSMLLCVPRAAGVCMMPVPFPQPPESVLTVLSLSGQGQPQVSPPGLPEQQPVWNHSFLFLGRDCATVFTPGAALVLEYYSTTTVTNALSWHMRCPVAFSALDLNQQLYSSLMSERGQRGLRLRGLRLQGCSLQTTSHTPVSVSLVLRLIGSECPGSVLSQVDCSQLPCMEPQLQGQIFFPVAEREIETPHSEPELELEKTDCGHSPPFSEHHTLQPPALLSYCSESLNPMQTSKEPQGLPATGQLQKDSYDLPAYDALAQVLPEYLHILKMPKAPQQSRGKPEEQKKSQKKSQLNQTFEIHSPREGLTVSTVQENDPHVPEVTEEQTKELENYRTAMCKMAEDILALRSQVASLEGENSQLRSELSLHRDLGRTLLDDTDIDVMTKTEITDRIISLKVKLASESSKAAEQRDKIQQLQNELIRKNDREKELVQLQQAHQQQQAVLQRYQGRIRKLAGLESTVHQQEKIIERMEKLLDTKLRERNKENTERKKAVLKHKDEEESKRREIQSVLAAENTRLREELERLRHQPPAVIIQQPAQLQQPLSDSEKLRLLGQMERAEAYIHTLEKQLEENARQWGREKQEMLIRLSEYDHGFTRTSTMILHNQPPKDVSDPVLRRVRQKHLDPLK
ncbi:hypothetical protein NFI96_031026 [Prochilodus magdalenae]|nr:hypothetical protein NFI96_031026 [Prochilodus magdalenae]